MHRGAGAAPRGNHQVRRAPCDRHHYGRAASVRRVALWSVLCPVWAWPSPLRIAPPVPNRKNVLRARMTPRTSASDTLRMHCMVQAGACVGQLRCHDWRRPRPVAGNAESLFRACIAMIKGVHAAPASRVKADRGRYRRPGSLVLSCLSVLGARYSLSGRPDRPASINKRMPSRALAVGGPRLSVDGVVCASVQWRRVAATTCRPVRSGALLKVD